MNYSISKTKFLSAVKIFNDSEKSKWTNDINILLDGTSRDWFVIEKPDKNKLNKILEAFSNENKLIIEDKGRTGKNAINQHFTQFSGYYLVLDSDKRPTINNIRG